MSALVRSDSRPRSAPAPSRLPNALETRSVESTTTVRRRPLPAACVELADKANRDVQRGSFRSALSFYTSAIAMAANLEPRGEYETYLLYFNRSAVRSRLELYKEALEDAEEVIRLEPECAAGYLRKGHALEDMFRFTDSLAAYERGLLVDVHSSIHAKLVRERARLAQLVEDTQIPLLTDSAPREEIANPGPRDADKARIEALADWLENKGASFSKVYLNYYGTDGSRLLRGAHARTRLVKDEIVMYVPFECIITSEVAKASEIGREIAAANCQLRSSHSYIAAFLLQEKHAPDSRWRLYLDVLQHVDLSGIPLFFSPEELQLLRGSMMLSKIDERNHSLRAEYRDLCLAVPSFKRWSLEEFVWARMAVVTRIYGLHVGDLKTDGLVPIGCMLNHDSGNSSWGVSLARSGFYIKAVTPIDRHQAITVNYGRKCNSRFFLNYGFVVENNDDSNEAMLILGVHEADFAYEDKLKLLGVTDTAVTPQPFFFQASFTDALVKMLCFARLVVADLSELDRFPSDFAATCRCEAISAANELAALAYLRAVAVRALAAFDCSIEEDLALLASLPPGNTRNCVVIRMGEKRVLHWLVDFCDLAGSCFDLAYSDLKRALSRWESKADPCSQPFLEVLHVQARGILPPDAVAIVGAYAFPDIEPSSLSAYLRTAALPVLKPPSSRSGTSRSKGRSRSSRAPRSPLKSPRDDPSTPRGRPYSVPSRLTDSDRDSDSDDGELCTCFPLRKRRPKPKVGPEPVPRPPMLPPSASREGVAV